MLAVTAPPRIGIVGAGRTRNGLGPFLATAFEQAGACVTGVAGRDLLAAAPAAAALEARLGHPVMAHASPAALAAVVDALVIAAPAAAHLAAVAAALEAGVPCLCEKPFVLPAQTDQALALVAAFGDRGLLLMENCQWPFVLDTMFALHPELVGTTIATLEMGLSPSARGRAMILDSLSHALSVAQVVAAVDPAGEVADIRQRDAGADAESDELRFDLRCQGGSALAVTLRLQRHETQPRPAWIALDGQRVDRRIGADYAMSLVTADERSKSLPDPLHSLVYRFASLLTRGTPDIVRILAESVATRLRCFRSVIDALEG